MLYVLLTEVRLLYLVKWVKPSSSVWLELNLTKGQPVSHFSEFVWPSHLRVLTVSFLKCLVGCVHMERDFPLSNHYGAT